MSLVEVLDQIKELLNKKGIDKNQFIEQIDYAIDKAKAIRMMVSGLDTYVDLVELIALQITDGDRNLAQPLMTLIRRYNAITEELDEENTQYFRKLIFEYLMK
jgi:hypothetical protein